MTIAKDYTIHASEVTRLLPRRASFAGMELSAQMNHVMTDLTMREDAPKTVRESIQVITVLITRATFLLRHAQEDV